MRLQWEHQRGNCALSQAYPPRHAGPGMIPRRFRLAPAPAALGNTLLRRHVSRTAPLRF